MKSETKQFFSAGTAAELSPGVLLLPARTFVLIVVDRDSGDFTVEGPMTDDSPWNRAVVQAQRLGRNLRCFGMGDATPDAAAAEWQAMHGGRRIAAGSIVTPS
jgi:hypothetical protein